MLQDRLSVKFQDVKFTVPKSKHEIFVRIEFMLLKLFHNLFAIIFSVVEIIIELFVVCQKVSHVMH